MRNRPLEALTCAARASFVRLIRYPPDVGLPIALSTAANSASSCRGFRRKAATPAFSCSLKAASSWAVIMIAGIGRPSSAKRFRSAKPLMLGICRSTIRHLGRPFGSVARNSSPDPNVRTLNTRDRSSRLNALSTPGSSSTTAIQGGISGTADHAIGVGCRPRLQFSVRRQQPPMHAPFHARDVRQGTRRTTWYVPPGKSGQKSGTPQGPEFQPRRRDTAGPKAYGCDW
jgi:hypothetical protein